MSGDKVKDASGTVLYFAFGSNLLAERLSLTSCCSVTYPASLESTGYIRGWRLHFARKSKSWRGSTATIVKDPSRTVWGAIWRIKESELPNLDEQEGIASGIYRRVSSPGEVTVENEKGEPVHCYSYIMNHRFDPGLPSPQYKHVICKGAQQIALPESYLEELNSIPVNDNDIPVTFQLSVLPNGCIP